MTIIQIIFGVLFLIVKLILFRLVIQAYILKRIAVYFHLEWSIWLLCDFFQCKELVLWLVIIMTAFFLFIHADIHIHLPNILMGEFMHF